MIELYMETINVNGYKTQTPVKLIIDKDVYVYDDGKFFHKLKDYINSKIKVNHLGDRSGSKIYKLHNIHYGLDGYKLDLRDK